VLLINTLLGSLSHMRLIGHYLQIDLKLWLCHR